MSVDVKVPPGAFLLGAPEPNTANWYGLRRQGITATDLPQILGLSSYGNARTVWHNKRGEISGDDLSEAGQWGHLLEDVVAQEWARRTGNTVSRVGILGSKVWPWMLASCDRLIDGVNAALEVKTRNQFAAGKWRDEIPDDVLAQVAWQRMVGDFDYVEVACLIGGQRLVTYRYEEDADLEAYLARVAEEVWEKVRSGIPPAVDMDGVLVRLLEQLYADRKGTLEVTVKQAAGLIEAADTASKAAKMAEAAKDASKAWILSIMGENEVLTYDDEPLFTYRAQNTHSISVRDLEDNDPELYLKVLEGGHITTTTSRVLRTGKGAKGFKDGD